MESAIEELTTPGIKFGPASRAQFTRTLVGPRRAGTRRKAQPQRGMRDAGRPESDETFAYIAGSAEGGTPYGFSRQEWEQTDRSRKAPPVAESEGQP